MADYESGEEKKTGITSTHSIFLEKSFLVKLLMENEIQELIPLKILSAVIPLRKSFHLSLKTIWLIYTIWSSQTAL